jgi:branched-chain amino acid transport system ATP-binding protein
MDLVMAVCDRVVVLDFGRCVASGTPDQVKQDPQVAAAYLGSDVPPSVVAGTAASGEAG